jgi:hypothetical protein
MPREGGASSSKGRTSTCNVPCHRWIARPEADEPDDYRHRMLTNVAGVAVVALLIVIGIWIADTMASMRKNQDCVLSGRRGCTPVEAPPPGRW